MSQQIELTEIALKNIEVAALRQEIAHMRAKAELQTALADAGLDPRKQYNIDAKTRIATELGT